LRVLIAGNSAAGVSCAQTIRRLKPDAQITLVGAEDAPFYSRCLLSYYIAGELERKRLFLRTRDWYHSNRIELVRGERIARVKPTMRQAVLESGRSLQYDFLVVATGSSAAALSIPGFSARGVFTLRNLDHADAILRFIRSRRPREAVVLGGGFIGLKVAYALRVRGMKVTVIEKLNQIMPRMLDKKGSKILSSFLVRQGINVRIGASISEIRARAKDVSSVRLEDGKELRCDLLVVAVGVKPNTELLPRASSANGGIITDEFMRTKFERIFACGDVAVTTDLVTGERTINALWFNAVQQGRVAGQNIAGTQRKYPGSFAANAVEFFGYPVIALGAVSLNGASEVISSYIPRGRVYKRLLFCENRLVGAILMGDVEAAGVFGALIRTKEQISPPHKELLNNPWRFSEKLGKLLANLSGEVSGNRYQVSAKMTS
jgi:NAD(P)H-nitrite reductase large subunit